MTGNPSVELAARMPWTVAEPDTWWEVTGQVNPQHTFTTCIARVLPQYVTGTDEPLFEILLHGSPPLHVTASAITRARRLDLVDAAQWDRAREQLREIHDLVGRKDLTDAQITERIADVTRWVER